jgi:hypothetical protein
MNLISPDIKKDVLMIFGLSVILLVVLISNPWYYSHDELQKLDHIYEHGMIDYIKSYVVIAQAESFAHPVRPFSFLVQGILALGMEQFPVLVHLFDVMTHAAAASLFYIVLYLLGVKRYLALTSAIIFLINPMTIIATGWSAALMDRWYVLFGLFAFLSATRYLNEKQCVGWLVCLFVCSSLAILSKETAIVLPGTLAIFVFIRPDVLKSRHFYFMSVVLSLPVIIYILFRMPAILRSFQVIDNSPYSTSVLNIPIGLVVYFAYPLLVTLTEASNWVFIDVYWIAIACIGHLIVPLMLWRQIGFFAAFGYLYLYLIFILPVLPLQIKSAHYLYGSALVFSFSLGYIFYNVCGNSFAKKAYTGFLAVSLFAHSIYLQFFVYYIGSNMHNAMVGLESSYMALKSPRSLELRAEPGSPEHILHRFVTGRTRVGQNFRVEMKVVNWEDPLPSSMPVLAMDSACRVYVMSDGAADYPLGK